MNEPTTVVHAEAPVGDAPVIALADGRPRHPDPAHVTLERWTGQLGNAALLLPLLAVVGVLTVLAFSRSDISPWLARGAGVAWLLLAGGLTWLRHRWPALAHARATWAVDDQGLDVRRGVWWRREVAVPRSRIQHTDVTQGPIERRLGLATLVVHTAGTRHAAVAVPGLAVDDARAVRDFLAAAVDRDDAV
jgi:membrane protein YdbS with pleckstrin-like domain